MNLTELLREDKGDIMLCVPSLLLVSYSASIMVCLLPSSIFLLENKIKIKTIQTVSTVLTRIEV